MKYLVFALLSAFVLGGVLFLSRPAESVPPSTTSSDIGGEREPSVIINEYELQLEVVRTPEEQARGLSGRESLDENAGMLFVFEEPRTPSFWMKEMNFPIDIIWIAADSIIVDITENALPESFPQTFFPRAPVQYVLEVNANWARNHNVSRGDKITLDLIQ